MQNYLPAVLVSLVVIAIVIRNQLRTIPVTPVRTYLMPLIFCLYGIGLVIFQDHGRFIDPAHAVVSAALLVVELAVAVALGYGRAVTVIVWRDAKGALMRRGTGWTAAAWIGSILVRLGFAGGAYLMGIHSAIGLVMVFLAVTLLAQNMFIVRRGRSAAIAATVQA
ncbi:MAG TPA: hypothetical protein VGL93_12635 [Streptosporangiaceae bacterium]|jgi:hypothetical protein